MLSKSEEVILQLAKTPDATAREISHSLGLIDGRDVASALKWLVRGGFVSATPERLDANGYPVRTRYRLIGNPPASPSDPGRE